MWPFIIRSDFRSDVDNGILGTAGCPRLVSPCLSPQALTPKVDRKALILSGWLTQTCSFSSLKTSCAKWNLKCSPGAKENVFGFDSNSQRTQTLALRVLSAFFGVKQPGIKQPEKRLSHPACSSVPRNILSGLGVRRPPSFVAGHCPSLGLHRF